MIKNVIRTKPYFFKTLALGLCMISIFSGTALAKSGDVQATSVQSQNTQTESPMLEKQKEIDKYVFEEHADEIEKKGFMVTYTSPFDNYVEIGISPFTQENADYLYGIFGNEEVKVVEGEKVFLMSGGINNTGVVTTTAVKEEKPNTSSSAMPVVYTMTGFLAVGGAVFAIGKRKAAR